MGHYHWSVGGDGATGALKVRGRKRSGVMKSIMWKGSPRGGISELSWWQSRMGLRRKL